MKESITIYKNAVIGRFKDRRIAVRNDKDGIGYIIEFTNIIRGKKWRTAKVKRIHNCRVTTGIRLSKEAIFMLYQCIAKLNENVK